MRTEKLEITVEMGTIDELTEEENVYVGLAKNEHEKAGPHISKYHVGVAILADNGETYVHSNMESDTFTQTTHAELNAINLARRDGVKSIDLLVVYVKGKPEFPCGQCRQYLYELLEDAKIIAAGSNGEFMKGTLKELLPYGFRLERD